MDISRASNFERFIYDLRRGVSERICGGPHPVHTGAEEFVQHIILVGGHDELVDRHPPLLWGMATPAGRMTPFQQAQMFGLNDPNIFNIALEGVFDDCQDVVNDTFCSLEVATCR